MTEPGPEPAFEPPARAEEAPPPPPAESPEAPRRRSTVREPAVMRFDDAPPPTPAPDRTSEPQVTNDRAGSDEGEIAPERPRRSGWWQRR
jgi:hypothetical protein